MDPGTVEARITQAIHNSVAAQVAAGVDIARGGENSTTAYALYIQDRLRGVGPAPAGNEHPKTAQHADVMDHSDLFELMAQKTVGLSWFDRLALPAAIGPVSYGDTGPLARDLSHLTAASRNIAPVRMRMRTYWGNHEGPRAHGYEALKTLCLPDDKALPPGVTLLGPKGLGPGQSHILMSGTPP